MSIGMPMGLAMASGLNTYLPLLVLSLIARYGHVVHLSPKFQWLISDEMIVILAICVLCEVLADKFPGLDHVWDFIHTLLRPIAGAIAAGATISADNLFEMILVMLLGGSIASAAHAAKATVRLASTAKSLGTANPILSIVEDLTSLMASLFAVFAPWLMAIIVVFFVAFAAMAGPPLLRTARFNLAAVVGALGYYFRRIAGSSQPRELRESWTQVDSGTASRLQGLLEKEEVLGALHGWKRTGWGPRRMWLLITSERLVLAEHQFPGRLKTRSVAFSDVQLVRDGASLLLARLEIFTKEKHDLVLLLPKPQQTFARLAAQRICELAGLERDVVPVSESRLVAAT